MCARTNSRSGWASTNASSSAATGSNWTGRSTCTANGNSSCNAGYAWQELADVRVELIGSSLGEKLIAAISLFDADSNGESSLFGFVLVTVTRRAAPADPLVVRVPLKLRWRPGQAWVDAVQARLHQALREAGAGGYPA